MLKFDFNVIFTIINLLVLYFLFKKFLFDRVNDVLQQRQALVDQEYKAAGDARALAQADQEKYTQALAQADTEADAIVQQGRERAREEYDRIVTDARQAAGQEQEKARAAIARDREDAMRQVKAQVGQLVALAAGRVMEEGVSEEVNARLYAEMMAEAGERE